jgi:hypothetical protein
MGGGRICNGVAQAVPPLGPVPVQEAALTALAPLPVRITGLNQGFIEFTVRQVNDYAVAELFA